MPAREEKFAEQIDNALSDKRLLIGHMPSRIAELPFESQQLFATLMIQVINHWAIQYKYNIFTGTPQNLGQLGSVLMPAYEEWVKLGGKLEGQ